MNTFFQKHKESMAAVVGIGLTAENIKTMQQGTPVSIDVSKFDPALRGVKILVFYDDGNALAMFRQTGLIDEDTKIAGES